MKKFYTNNNGQTNIRHHDLIYFLGENGFKIMEYPNGGKQLVRICDNIIDSATENDLVTCVKDFLIKETEFDALEVFTKGVNTFTTTKKLQFLPKIEFISDKDPKDIAWFYFSNTAVKITKNNIELVPYSILTHPIWKNRILNREFAITLTSEGQFYNFMFLISKKKADRFLALQTAIGYLLHRYNDPSLPKVIIFNDEEISTDGSANGGTGKGLLAQAIGFCKNLEIIDGQQIKSESRFKNQRINTTTDIVLYDDVTKKFSLDELKSMATSGITIEKKGKDEIHLPFKEAPKIMINSNYPVLGSGGATDKRRRYEFEVAKYFNNIHTPIIEFGNLFFDDWNKDEWNRFDLLMMETVQVFLNNSLVEATPINLVGNKILCTTNAEFRIFSKKEFNNDIWLKKELLFTKFKVDYPQQIEISSHQFTKWIIEYAKIHELSYESKNPGGVQQFILRSNIK